MKKITTPRPPSARDSAFILRTADANLRSTNQFQWPEKGYVACPDWNARPRCGGGLHGLLHGKGDYSLLALGEPTAKWLVVRVRAKDVVTIDDQKVKFREGWVEFVGEGAAACAALLKLDPKAEKKNLPFNQSAANGYLSQSAANGYRSQSAANGYLSQSAANGYRSQSAANGYRSQSAANGDLSQSAANGDLSRSIALGAQSRAKAGSLGLIILLWWDNVAQRERIVVGYVGENGIKADKWYTANGRGELVVASDTAYEPFTAPDAAAKARAMPVPSTPVTTAKKAAA